MEYLKQEAFFITQKLGAVVPRYPTKHCWLHTRLVPRDAQDWSPLDDDRDDDDIQLAE